MISECVKHGKLNLFADDTLLTLETTNVPDGIKKINEDLQKIYFWLNQNKLKLNVCKSKYMIVGENSVRNLFQENINVNNEEIERVKSLKYLGVTIDEKLNFVEHVSHIESKVLSKIYLLNRIRKKLDTQTAKTIYDTTIQPYFDYCPSVLFMCDKSSVKKMQVLQNKAIRTVLNRNLYENCAEMLKELNMLNVWNRIVLNVLCIIYKMKNNLLPPYLCENLIYVSNVYQNMTLRNQTNFRLPMTKKANTQKNIFYKGLKLYNLLPSNIKVCNTYDKFKSDLRKYLIDEQQGQQQRG